MPFKSEAQKKKFQQLLKEGKIKPGVYKEWEDATGDSELPKRVGTKGSIIRRPRRDRK